MYQFDRTHPIEARGPRRSGASRPSTIIVTVTHTNIPRAANDNEPPKTPTRVRRVFGAIAKLFVTATVVVIISHHVDIPTASNDNAPPAKVPAPHVVPANDNKAPTSQQKGSVFGGHKGTSGAGRANFMTGSLPSANSMKLVTTSNGARFWANPKSALQLQGFVNDLEAQGAPITDIGGYNPRHIAGSTLWSQHAYGNAIDIDQLERNKVSAAFGAWAKSHPQTIREAARKYGIISGGDWRNPDFGHFEWGGVESGSRNVPVPKLFTVHQGRRYRATVNLRGVEQLATKEMIEDRLRRLGFTEVEVKGSGATREAQARWPGPDTTSPIDKHLTNVLELAGR